MKKKEVLEMPDFEYSSKGFSELKTALKEGKIVRNPFAKFYGENIEVTVMQAPSTGQKKSGTRKVRSLLNNGTVLP